MTNMNQSEAWAKIVAELMRRQQEGATYRALNVLLGEPQNGTKAYKICQGYTKGKQIGPDTLRQYMKGLGIRGGDGLVSELPPEGFGLVPKSSARVGAGSSLLTSDEIDGHYAFREDFLRRLGPKSRPKLFDVLGDSGEPFVLEGDAVLIDEGDTSPIRSGQLYAVGVGEDLHLKRVYEKPDGTLVLKSDNTQYPEWEIPKHERPRIVGRARWIGRML